MIDISTLTKVGLPAQGRSNAEIADGLVLSVLTVRTHIQRALTRRP
ncbi:hypothetical protein GCM10023084_24650 [Streptomyces lacrimifluminis]|uniref:HTH luxR-type domain-containing protein n=1 Tax=Streptomyces lacrimifluminis TaxID=1500077 RepID=A0A917KJD4_9ACTN|nr:hypothetical protein GCM10012282_08600 [Streptomyces lacrimifluminis]